MLEAGNDNSPYFADFYQPFLINACNVRGNVVRLGQAVDVILSRHDYPEAMSQLLAEQLVLACMLSGNLEEMGKLTIQAKGGEAAPVKFSVVTVNEDGDVKGYIELNEGGLERLASLKKQGGSPEVSEFLGRDGFLALTISSGATGSQYQGVVSLEGDSLADALAQYFTQSQQLQVSIKVALGKVVEQGKPKWFASGIMLQRMPSVGGTQEEPATPEEDEENWNRCNILMNTVTNEELLNPTLSPQDLLLRLFNEDGVWVFDPKRLQVNCNCSRDRIEDVLSTFNDEDLEHMKSDGGVISVNCQFCNKTEVFREEDIEVIRMKRDKG